MATFTQAQKEHIMAIIQEAIDTNNFAQAEEQLKSFARPLLARQDHPARLEMLNDLINHACQQRSSWTMRLAIAAGKLSLGNDHFFIQCAEAIWTGSNNAARLESLIWSNPQPQPQPAVSATVLPSRVPAASANKNPSIMQRVTDFLMAIVNFVVGIFTANFAYISSFFGGGSAPPPPAIAIASALDTQGRERHVHQVVHQNDRSLGFGARDQARRQSLGFVVRAQGDEAAEQRNASQGASLRRRVAAPYT